MRESPSPDTLPATWKEIFSVWFAGEKAPESLLQAILEETGAFRHGHFVGTSGKHLAEYVDKNVLYSYPATLAFFARQIALRLSDRNDLTVVAGPAHGATVLVNHVAACLTMMVGHPVRPVFLTKKEKTEEAPPDESSGGESKGIFELREAFRDIVPGQFVLLIEDILTTGASAHDCVRAIHEAGATVAAIAALVQRGPVLEGEEWQALSDRFALMTLQLPSYLRGDCPLCQKVVPVDQRPGHGREFLIELSAKNPKLAERLGYQSIPKHLRKPAPALTE